MPHCDGSLNNCPYLQNMQAEHVWRDDMRTMLTDVHTKMNALVGADGTNGRVGDIDNRVKSLEGTRARYWGAIGAVSVIWTAALALLEHFRK